MVFWFSRIAGCLLKQNYKLRVTLKGGFAEGRICKAETGFFIDEEFRLCC
jgi:hypothetical protein